MEVRTWKILPKVMYGPRTQAEVHAIMTEGNIFPIRTDRK